MSNIATMTKWVMSNLTSKASIFSLNQGQTNWPKKKRRNPNAWRLTSLLEPWASWERLKPNFQSQEPYQDLRHLNLPIPSSKWRNKCSVESNMCFQRQSKKIKNSTMIGLTSIFSFISKIIRLLSEGDMATQRPSVSSVAENIMEKMISVTRGQRNTNQEMH